MLFQRLKLFNTEIDLIFSKENEILLVEVKTLNNGWRAFERIGKSQRTRIQKNFLYLSSKFKGLRFRVFVAWVETSGKISFAEVD